VFAQEYAKHSARFDNRQQDATHPCKENKGMHSE